jgi:tRNA-specific 2-thiouridylase
LVNFAAPQYGVSPGQAAVFYRGDRVLGGGWIARPAQEPLA